MSDLYDKLAEAYARPSGAYRDTRAALDAVENAGKGYLEGQEIADSIRKRKFLKSKVANYFSGGEVPFGISPDATTEEFQTFAPTLKSTYDTNALMMSLGIKPPAKTADQPQPSSDPSQILGTALSGPDKRVFRRSDVRPEPGTPSSSSSGGVDGPSLPPVLSGPTGKAVITNVMTERKDKEAERKRLANQEATDRRQQERLQQQRDLFKGSQGAIDTGQDAMKASEAMTALNSELDAMPPGPGEVNRRLASSPAAMIRNPKLYAMKKNIMLYAGFSRGGKQLTGTELGTVVNALTPTPVDTTESRHYKNEVFQNWAAGKIDLYKAANLLGNSGAPLIAVANKIKAREAAKQDQMRATAEGTAIGAGGEPTNEELYAISQGGGQ